MAGAPPDVADLQRRLQVARQEWARHVGEITALRTRAARAEAEVAAVAAILGADQEPEVMPDTEAVRRALEAMRFAASGATAAIAADRRLQIIREVYGLMVGPNPSLRFGRETIGDMQDAVRVLSLLRTELDDEDANSVSSRRHRE